MTYGVVNQTGLIIVYDPVLVVIKYSDSEQFYQYQRNEQSRTPFITNL